MSDDPADLSRLHDIALPPEVSWWPLAPGWIALAVVGVLSLSYFGYRRFKSWKQNAYRRDAIRELASADTPAEIAELIKRTALVIAPREEIAGLHGESWINWLTSHDVPEPPPVVGTLLNRALYDPDTSADQLPALRDFASQWILQHSRPC
ncbi:DUF4381 domain-containing protein [Haloferula sp.]|uniref:DUF4381 domain-containing protein n=1 Tax=Haloferula sp. TaxID=2497595 RepID=UPI00329FA8AD